MTLHRTQRDWDQLGVADPLWAILSYDEKNDGRWQTDEFFATGEAEISELFQYLQRIGVDVRHQRALDFGCGVGRLTQALARRFDAVYGVDIAPSMIAQATAYNQYPDRCHYLVNSNDDLSQLQSTPFDFICSYITLQHIHPCYSRRYIAELTRLLADGGVAVLQIPDEPAGGARIRYKYWLKCWLPDPALLLYRRLRFGDDRNKMEMYGLRISEVRDVVGANGGRLADVRMDPGRDFSGGSSAYPILGSSLQSSGWVSMQYVIRKG